MKGQKGDSGSKTSSSSSAVDLKEGTAVRETGMKLQDYRFV